MSNFSNKVCLLCKKSFKPQKGLLNYCSLSCKNTRSKESMEKLRISNTKSIEHVCQNEGCKKNFYDKPSANRKYCSQSCSLKSQKHKKVVITKKNKFYTHVDSLGNKFKTSSKNEHNIIKILEENHVLWAKNTNSFNYKLPYEDDIKSYIPSLLLLENNIYIDCKKGSGLIKESRKFDMIRKENKIRVYPVSEIEDWFSFANLIGLFSPFAFG